MEEGEGESRCWRSESSRECSNTSGSLLLQQEVIFSWDYPVVGSLVHSPAAECGGVVQSCSLGSCGRVSGKCQLQQNTPRTQQSLRVL